MKGEQTSVFIPLNNWTYKNGPDLFITGNVIENDDQILFEWKFWLTELDYMF